MKQYIVLFEMAVESKVYKYYMVATEKTTMADIERFCRDKDWFGSTNVTITELEQTVDEIEGLINKAL